MGKLTLSLLVLVLSVSAQSVSKETYDFNYIGQPLADPLLQHSKETYVLFGCAYCHGLNLVSRGEATDLMHSRLVGRDVNGNLIGPLLRAGIPQTAKLSPMPQFSDLSDQQIGALVRWMHYARQQGRFRELTETKDLPAGGAAAGKTYFEQNCGSCHAARDLAKAAAKYNDAALRAQILHPKGIDAPVSYKMEHLNNTKTIEARDRHLHLLENYSATDVANLSAYARSLQ
ncbi:MAG: c-type cytochrome [Bryobacteraceae bacterium]